MIYARITTLSVSNKVTAANSFTQEVPLSNHGIHVYVDRTPANEPWVSGPGLQVGKDFIATITSSNPATTESVATAIELIEPKLSTSDI